MEVGVEVGIATAGEIKRTRTGLIIKVFGGFKVEKKSFDESLTLKEAGLTVEVFGEFKV
jgi:hypothetical protein